MAPNVCTKTDEDLFLEGIPKKIFMVFVEGTFVGKVAQKIFGQVWENSGKILRTPKSLPPPTPMASTAAFESN